MAATVEQEPGLVANDDGSTESDDPFIARPEPPKMIFEPVDPQTPLAEGKHTYHQAGCGKALYETAIEQLKVVVDSKEYDLHSRAIAAYWRAEALVQLNWREAHAQPDLASAVIANFQAVADSYMPDFLAHAALRRANNLRTLFETIHKSQAEDVAG